MHSLDYYTKYTHIPHNSHHTTIALLIVAVIVCALAITYQTTHSKTKQNTKSKNTNEPSLEMVPSTDHTSPSIIERNFNPKTQVLVSHTCIKCEYTCATDTQPLKMKYDSWTTSAVIPIEAFNKFTHGLRIAFQERKGDRPRMENSVKVMTFDQLYPQHSCTNNSKQHCFALFDGHLGKEAADFCILELPKMVANCIASLHDEIDDDESSNENETQTDGEVDDVEHDFTDFSQFADDMICNAIRDAFHETDLKFQKYATKNECKAGAVGVFVLYSGGQNVMYVANVGDCRAILCSKGKCTVLTEEHSAEKNMEERERCKNFIDQKTYRVGGQLSVTRAIGDFLPCPCPQSSSKSTPSKPLITDDGTSKVEYKKLQGMICDPHVIKHTLTDDDEFLIIACDGLWDVTTPELAMNTVRKMLRRSPDCNEAAQGLISWATARGTTDNVSVMVIAFAHKLKNHRLQIGPEPMRLSRSRLRKSQSFSSIDNRNGGGSGGSGVKSKSERGPVSVDKCVNENIFLSKTGTTKVCSAPAP